MYLTLGLILLLLPLAFQWMYGYKSATGHLKLKFWLVCVISFVLWIISASLNLYLFVDVMHTKGIRCGTPTVGLMAFELFIGLCVIVSMIIQILIKKKR